MFEIAKVLGEKSRSVLQYFLIIENIYFYFKQTIEALGVAAGSVLQTPIQLAYREAFQNIVVPSFDRAMQNIFQQVNEVFVKGTRESKSRNAMGKQKQKKKKN